MLTTQYLEEADTLADEIIVIDHGRVIAEGTPRELKEASKGALPRRHVGRAHTSMRSTHCNRSSKDGST